MSSYHTKAPRLPGTSLSDVSRFARTIFKSIKRKTKRKPYIRSAYFKKKKVLFDFFWVHLQTKSPKDRFERLQYFEAAVELIEKSHNKPSSKRNPNKKTEILHRLEGTTSDGFPFYVQIKENTRSKNLYFMSCFPRKK